MGDTLKPLGQEDNFDAHFELVQNSCKTFQ